MATTYTWPAQPEGAYLLFRKDYSPVLKKTVTALTTDLSTIALTNEEVAKYRSLITPQEILDGQIKIRKRKLSPCNELALQIWKAEPCSVEDSFFAGLDRRRPEHAGLSTAREIRHWYLQKHKKLLLDRESKLTDLKNQMGEQAFAAAKSANASRRKRARHEPLPSSKDLSSSKELSFGKDLPSGKDLSSSNDLSFSKALPTRGLLNDLPELQRLINSVAERLLRSPAVVDAVTRLLTVISQER